MNNRNKNRRKGSGSATRVLDLPLDKAERLKEILDAMEFTISEGEHLVFRASGGKDRGAALSFYKSGRIVIQGKEQGVSLLSSLVVEIAPAGDATGTGAEQKNRVGSDESGKGDYFGPLVTAAVFADKKAEKRLRELGARDSKRISDNEIERIAPEIKKICDMAVVVLNPGKYNNLYSKVGNLNKLLAWSHARVIEDLCSRNRCDLIVVDRFARGDVLKKALMEKSREVKLLEITRGERDIAVAAASILARDEFLFRMRQLSRTAGFVLPLGATNVSEAAMRLAKKVGLERLGDYVKLHFRTTSRIIDRVKGEM